jgi:hypothetical protein
VSYLLPAESYTYVCRTWDDLAARLVRAPAEGYRPAKASRVDRPLLPSERVRLVEDATRLALTG